jgi:glycine/D-amino acid oxidase-like deaminating enzyme
VVSAGIRSRSIAQALGDRVNVYPVKGYSITVQLDDTESQRAAPWVSLLDDRPRSWGVKNVRIARSSDSPRRRSAFRRRNEGKCLCRWTNTKPAASGPERESAC